MEGGRSNDKDKEEDAPVNQDVIEIDQHARRRERENPTKHQKCAT